MPFEKGKATPGAGRKGFEIEAKEMERMKKILTRYFNLLEKDKLTEDQYKLFIRLEKAALKIMDKRHASKGEMKVELDKPILIIDESD